MGSHGGDGGLLPPPGPCEPAASHTAPNMSEKTASPPNWSMGPKNGVYRAQNYGKNNYCLSFFVFNVIMGFEGVLIIPKWLINDS